MYPQIKKINNRFPGIKAVRSEDFDGTPGGIWFRGTEEYLINDLPLLNHYWEVHPVLSSFLEDNGLFAEPFDAGTLMAWEV